MRVQEVLQDLLSYKAKMDDSTMHFIKLWLLPIKRNLSSPSFGKEVTIFEEILEAGSKKIST